MPTKIHIEDNKIPDLFYDLLEPNEKGNWNEDQYKEVIESMQGPIVVVWN